VKIEVKTETEKEFKIYIIYSGPFGEQIINNFAVHGIGDKIICLYEFEPETIEREHPSEPDVLKKIWDEPSKYVPKNLPVMDCDLLIVLGIHPLLGDIIPSIAQKLNAKAVLYPLDDRERIPEGLKTIQDDLEAAGIFREFPRPFCVMEQSDNEFINYLCEKVGKPEFNIEIDEDEEIIKEIEVIRDTPCGSARSVAKKLAYYPYNDMSAFKEKITTEHENEENENYCLASMDPLEPLMQEAADILVESIYEACGFPTVGDRLLEEIEKKGEVSLDEITHLFVYEMKVCDAPRTLERTVDELVSRGKIKKIEGEETILTIA
jgi:hypothetical protein